MSECVKRQGYHLLTDTDPELVNSDQQQAIFERLLVRNSIRREMGVRPINIPVIYERKKRMNAEARYDEIIQPYIDVAFRNLDWPDSFSGRLLLGVKTYHQCAAQCERDTSHANPREGVPDILKLIHQYVAPLS